MNLSLVLLKCYERFLICFTWSRQVFTQTFFWSNIHQYFMPFWQAQLQSKFQPSLSFAGLQLALFPFYSPPTPSIQESILQVNSFVIIIQFICSLSPNNLREFCWAMLSFNFDQTTPQPKQIYIITNTPQMQLITDKMN